jgi:ferritin-like metal-binding protein YciE
MNTALHALFIDELKDIYDAEQQLVQTLPKLADAAGSQELRKAFESHCDETTGHVSRLEKVFEALNEKPDRKKCRGISGILAEGDEMIKKQKRSEALDAALIAGAQKVEHYEIATYGTLCDWAEIMQHEKCVRLLNQSLEEEKKADRHLTKIANEVNQVAA